MDAGYCMRRWHLPCSADPAGINNLRDLLKYAQCHTGCSQQAVHGTGWRMPPPEVELSQESNYASMISNTQSSHGGLDVELGPIMRMFGIVADISP